MGSAGKKKGRRTRSDRGRPGPGFPDLQHSAFTPEGQIERYGAMAAGLRHARRRRPRLYWGFLALLGTPFIVAVIALLVGSR